VVDDWDAMEYEHLGLLKKTALVLSGSCGRASGPIWCRSARWHGAQGQSGSFGRMRSPARAAIQNQ
jgi:hypothetical protein